MTPDLPIPEAAREAALRAFNEHGVMSVRPANEPPRVWVCRCGEEFPDGGKPGAGREQFRPHVLDAILAAALPHLHSLQVETQVEVGRLLGRAEAAEEIAEACAERARLANRIPESTRSGVREGMIVAWIAAEKLAREIGSRETP
jgi:hypothetical protein